jgi:histidine triad (HIT) family protein
VAEQALGKGQAQVRFPFRAHSMHNHAPSNYMCPLCLAVKGVESEGTMMKQNDIFYRDAYVMAAINSKFIEGNEGHVIVLPLDHFENIYTIPELNLSQIMSVAKKVAVALKEVRKCDGITLLQNNEPSGGQRAFHFHLHIFPRFKDDHFTEKLSADRVSKPEERTQFAADLKSYFVK